MNRTLIMLGLGLASVWETTTTVYGTSRLMAGGSLQIVISVAFGLFISAFLILTLPIIKNPSEDLIPTGAKILWFLAVLYDLYTAFMGNMDLVLGQSASGVHKVIIAVGITVFICSAPIGLSSMIYERKSIP